MEYCDLHTHSTYSDGTFSPSQIVAEGLRKKLRAVALTDHNTVAHFASLRDLPITTIYDFRERKVDSGWIDDFDAFTRRQWEDFNFKLTDGETLSEVQTRNITALQEVMQLYKGKTIVIGSHGTALSTIINYFTPQFGIEEFVRIKSIMPWIVHFAFSDSECVQIEEFNLFSGASRRWLKS